MKKSELKTQISFLKLQLKFAYGEYQVWKRHYLSVPKWQRKKLKRDFKFGMSYNEYMMDYWKEQCKALKTIIKGLEELL